MLAFALEHRKQTERARRCEQVGRHVEQRGVHRLVANRIVPTRCQDGSHDKHDGSGVRDTRVGQHALDVRLHECAEVTGGHRK